MRAAIRRSALTRAALAAAPALALMAGALALSPAASAASGAASGPEGQTLTVSQVDGLDPAGAKVTVTGAGYNMEKGIYVAFCVAPAPGQTPTPCGGGADMSGAEGLSGWISSNPPSYGRDLATPYGPGGTFDVQLTITPMIGSIDCRATACAVVTRADHTRISDRTQDVIVPVTWGEPVTRGEPAATSGAAPPATGSTAAATTGSAGPPTLPASSAADATSEPTSSPEATTSTSALAAESDSGDEGSGGVLIALGTAAGAVLVAAGLFGARRRMARTSGSGGNGSGGNGPGGNGPGGNGPGGNGSGDEGAQR